MIKWCSVTFAAVMFADCVAVWAATVLADVLVFAVAAAVLAAVTVLNDVVELPAAAASAAVALTSLASVAVAACFAVESVCGSAAELSKCLLKVLL